MLTFFRKYQKIFFVFVTIITVSSFVFFGTYGSFSPTREKEDRELFRDVEGQSVNVQIFEKFSRLIGSESAGRRTSFLNDSILARDILAPGLGAVLFTKFQEAFEGELQEKWEKERQYRPYSHPEARFLNAQSIWKAMGSDLAMRLEAYQLFEAHLEATSLDRFKAKVDLYLAEVTLPPNLLAYGLRAKEREYQLQNDPRLYPHAVALFGYKNAEEWFGKAFIDRSTAFLFNLASYAKAHGYSVSKAEARAELEGRMREFVKASRANGRGYSAQDRDPRALIEEEMQEFGLREEEALEIITLVMLSRKIMADVEAAALADTKALRSLYAHASQAVDIELVEIKEPELKDYEDFKRFECYLSKVASQISKKTELAEAVDSIEEIEKRAPELVRRRFVLYTTQVTQRELSDRVPLVEILAWQKEPANQEKIRTEFPGLQDLEKDPEKLNQEKLNQFAAGEIARAHPEWVREALAEKKSSERSFLVGARGEGINLEGVKEVRSLFQLLDKGEIVKCHSDDGENFWRIEVKSKAEEKELLSFKEAVSEGILDGFLAKEESDSIYREKAQRLFEMATREGLAGLKEDSRTKDQAAALCFYGYLSELCKGEQGSLPLITSQIRTEVGRELPSEESKVQAGACRLPWQVKRRELALVRSQEGPVDFNVANSLEKGQARLELSEQGHLQFYRVLEKRDESGFPAERLFELQALIGSEVRMGFGAKVVDRMGSCGAYVQ